MGVHIYCIVARGQQPDGELAGVGGATVLAAHAPRLAVWYSEHDAPPAADEAAIRAHHAIVQTAMTPERTPVPVRFGQWFAGVHAALEQVAAEETKWLEHLTCFAGCAEFGVRIAANMEGMTAQDVQAPRTSGTAYMTALARRHADAQGWRVQGEAIAMRVHDALTGIIIADRVEIRVAAGLVRLAHLVARQREGEYHGVIDAIRRSRSDLRFSLTGPWPPYSFVA